MYNPATNQIILTHDIKWDVLDIDNSASDPTLFDFTKGTGH